MKTRIILKSFDALSYSVFLSPPSSGQTGGLGGSEPMKNPKARAAAARTDRIGKGCAFALSEGALWAGFIMHGSSTSTASNDL
jgi:hypothetical protein